MKQPISPPNFTAEIKQHGAIFIQDDHDPVQPPEVLLWRGVISNAVKDSGTLLDPESRPDAIDAIGWLLADTQDFEDVCELAKVDSELIRTTAWKFIRAKYPEKLISGVIACYEIQAHKTPEKGTLMPLTLLSGGGGKPFIRYSPSDDEWTRSCSEGEPVNVDFTGPVIVDIEKTQMGWLKLMGGRDFQPWPNNEPVEKPSHEHKQGFRVDFFSTKLFDDEPIREFSSSSAGVLNFIQDLYNKVEADGKFESGEVPVLKMLTAKKLRLGRGNTRIPQFEILKYVPRPEELEAEAQNVGAASDDIDAVFGSAPPKPADDTFDEEI